MPQQNDQKAATSGRKPCVLFIDDSPVDRTYIQGVLVNNGFNLLLAEDGPEGIKMARDQQPGLILLDILLPKVSGIEVCKRIKADPAIKHIPINQLLFQHRNQ